MRSFRQYLKEYFILLEDKKQDYINRWLKVHSDHPLVQNNPERAKSLIAHARSFGETVDEHHFLTRQLLDRTYKPGEDDPTIQMTLGKWRRGKQQNLVTGSLRDHTHDSVSELLDIPQLRTKTTTHSRGLEELAKYHIGEIEHPQHGTLQVHHVHHSDVKDFEEYKRISGALRKTCQGGYTWCVLPKEKDSGPKFLQQYSQGSGIFFYTNQEGTPVLSHGHGDRGIVKPRNNLVAKKEGKLIFDETRKLLSGDKKIRYTINNGQYTNLKPDQIKSALEDPASKNPAPKNPSLLDRFWKRFKTDPVDHDYSAVELVGIGMQSSDKSTVLAALNNPSFRAHPYHLTVALDPAGELFNNVDVVRRAVDDPNFGTDPDHISHALQSRYGFAREAAAKNRNFGTNPNHIRDALNSSHKIAVRAAVEHPSFGTDPNHIRDALEYVYEFAQQAAVKHSSFGTNPNHIGIALRSPYESVAKIAVEHPNFGTDPDHIHYALNSPYESIVTRAVDHPNFGTDPYHIHYALKSPHESVAKIAVEHPNFGTDPDHIHYALKSPHESVAKIAVEHPNFGTHPGYISSALNSSHESIVTRAVDHPNFGTHPNHIHHALRSDYKFAQEAAVKHPSFGTNPNHIRDALESPYESVREAAAAAAARLKQ